MGRLRELTKGILKENPVLVLLLGLCPTLAVTTGLTNAVGMGIAATFVLVCSNVIISALRRFFPRQIRIPCFIVVIATFVALVKMIMAGYFPALDEAMGIFIALIVVNCIILGRAEAFASRNGVLDSLLDGLGMGAGFTLALIVISGIRELLGSWRLFGLPVTSTGFDPVKVLVTAPGAFIVLGLVLALMAARARGRSARRKRELVSAEREAFEAARPEKARPKK